MSFSHDTKNALVTLSASQKHNCCRRAELYGILYSAGVFSRQRCKLVTTCRAMAELTIEWLDSLCHIKGNLYVTEHKSGEPDERSSCKITLPQRRELEALYTLFGYQPSEPEYHIKTEMFRCQGCRPAFVRGIFLSAGTITDPEKGYHLEVSLSDSERADELMRLLKENMLEAKLMQRKSEYVLYYKDSESIENFLAYIGANNAAFTIMNKKIEREIRSGANRLANGEMANITKAVAAAVDQTAAIKELISSGEIEHLPDELQKTAYLRLEHEDASLSQLASLHTPPITKSGVNHRLKKIVEWGK